MASTYGLLLHFEPQMQIQSSCSLQFWTSCKCFVLCLGLHALACAQCIWTLHSSVYHFVHDFELNTCFYLGGFLTILFIWKYFGSKAVCDSNLFVLETYFSLEVLSVWIHFWFQSNLSLQLGAWISHFFFCISFFVCAIFKDEFSYASTKWWKRICYYSKFIMNIGYKKLVHFLEI